MFPVIVSLLVFMSLIFLMRGRFLGLVIGFIVLGNAANLLIFEVAGIQRDAYPFIGADGAVPSHVADPLPQALVLTAIVIAFAVLCYLVALLKKAADDYGMFGNSDLLEELDDIDAEVSEKAGGKVRGKL